MKREEWLAERLAEACNNGYCIITVENAHTCPDNDCEILCDKITAADWLTVARKVVANEK